jgi:Zn-dependent metalloprotease
MENVTTQQRELLEKVREKVPDLSLRWNDERGVASMIEGNLLPWNKIGKPDEIVRATVKQFGLLLGPSDISEKYKVIGTRHKKEKAGHRGEAYQVFDNLPVYGANLLVFADEERGVYRIQSSFWRDVKVTAKLKLDERELQHVLSDLLRKDPDAARFEEIWRKQKRNPWLVEHFPLTAYPILYLYPVENAFHPAYKALAYQPLEWLGIAGQRMKEIGEAQLILDAATGEVILKESTKIGMAYTDETGDGLSTLQDSSSNYLLRTLPVVRKDGGNYFMINRLHTPEIRTFDAGGTESGLETKLKGDTDLSEDSDNHWNTTTTSCVTTTRQTAQQPEADGHFYAEETWNFYHNLGWDGFDDGLYGTHCPVRIATHIGMDANAYFSRYIEPDPITKINRHYGYLAFYDGYCDGSTLKFDFMAGDPVLFAHEYQHAVTYFGAANSNGEPGRIGTSGWHRSIHEGYSDAIACLRYGAWITPRFFPHGAIRRPATGDGPYSTTACYTTATVYCLPFRRIEYPRSTKTHRGDWYCDHYDDRDKTQSTQCFDYDYFRSTLLSHLAFLVGQGGVHQRASRGGSEFIPVPGIGLQRTAEIFHFALTQYFNTLPTTDAGTTMIEAARFLLDAAKNVPGSSNRKCEYVMMRRALYAMGMYPYDSSYNKQTYGGEACMLPWTYSWRFSQPYIGLPALWWQSPDLFINNNGSCEYNVDIGQENKVFARVRNIGDQELKNLRVKFYFSPMGTNLPASIAGWQPCKNQTGTDCTLDIASLPANSVTIADPNNPPANQAIMWYIDPSYVVAGLDHFCLRAVIEFTGESKPANHDNDCPSEVQSNISYEKGDSAQGFGIVFQVLNWEKRPKPLDLRIEHTLPKGFSLEYAGEIPLEKIILQRGEPLNLKWLVKTPKRKPIRLEPPFDGKVTAKVDGKVSGPFTGQLNHVQVIPERRQVGNQKDRVRIEGMLSGSVRSEASLHGQFTGDLDLVKGTLQGKFTGSVSFVKGRSLPNISLELEGALEPLRAINVTQRIDGKVVGGISIKVKVPLLKNQVDPHDFE